MSRRCKSEKASVRSEIANGEAIPRPDLSSQAVPRTLKNGAEVTIRPISPRDELLMIRFHRRLSERSVYMRYFESLSLAARTVHQRLAKICFADPEQQTVLVAVRRNQKSREEEILGVARLSKFENPKLGELALLIVDEFQGYGLGTELLRRLLQAAQEQHITRITAEML